MKLLLFHPGVAKIDCRDCVKRLYDLEKGEVVLSPRGPKRELMAITEKDGHKAPCRVGNVCAKGSPETAHVHELSPRNKKTLRIYLNFRHGFLKDHDDHLLAENLSLIDRVFEKHREKVMDDRAEYGAVKMAKIILGK